MEEEIVRRPKKKKKKKKPQRPVETSNALVLLEQLAKRLGSGILFVCRFFYRLVGYVCDKLIAWADRLMPDSNVRFRVVGIGYVLALCVPIIYILYFIGSADAAKWREIGKTINPAVALEIAPLRGSIYAADDRPVAVTAPVYKLYFDFRADVLKPLFAEPKDEKAKEAKEKLSRRLSSDLDKLALVLKESYAEQEKSVDEKALRERWRKAFQKGNRYTPVISYDINYLQYKELMAMEPFAPAIIDSAKNKREAKSLLARITSAPEQRGERFNPFGSLALRTIGDVYKTKKGKDPKTGKDSANGRFGLEASFDSILAGTPGRGMAIYGAQKTNLKVQVAPQDGYDVYTTLNMNIQSELERIMRKQLGHFKAASGTAILLDVPTGQVLSMSNLTRGANGEYWEEQNFAVTDLSEPGSTFKVAAMLVALDNGFVSPNDAIDVGNGLWQVGGRTVRDHNAHNGGYGRITISQVIEKSSNVGIAKIIHNNFANKPGEYVKQIRALGFEDDLRLELIGSARPKIRMPQKDTWYGTTLAWMSFGYETSIPPIYTAAIFNAIANNGKLMKPYLVREVRDNKGQVIKTYPPTVVKEQIAKPSSIAAIQDMLRKVVTDGTGKKLNSKVVAVSGKSGTAQLAKGKGYRGPDGVSHQVSFCGYFPSESPRYTLMVVIREPSKEFAAGGGSMAGPVVKELAEAIVSMERPSHLDSIGLATDQHRQRHIAPGRKATIHQLTQDIRSSYKPSAKVGEDSFVEISSMGEESALPRYKAGIVPSVIGMTASDANYLLMRSGYRSRIEGYGRVVAQNPVAGTRSEARATVSLTLREK